MKLCLINKYIKQVHLHELMMNDSIKFGSCCYPEYIMFGTKRITDN